VENNPVVWFEIPVADMDRAKAFYGAVFDVKLDVTEMGDSVMAWFPMDQNTPGAAGALIKDEEYVPSTEGALVYFGVESIEEALKNVVSNGGEQLLAKTSIGEHGFIGRFLDTEGNQVALHSRT